MIKKLEKLKDLLKQIEKESLLLIDPRWEIEVKKGSACNSSEGFEKYYFDIDCDIDQEVDELFEYYDRLESISIVFG